MLPPSSLCRLLFFQLIEEGNTETERVQLRSLRAATLDLHYYYNKPPSQAANIRRSSQQRESGQQQTVG